MTALYKLLSPLGLINSRLGLVDCVYGNDGCICIVEYEGIF